MGVCVHLHMGAGLFCGPVGDTEQYLREQAGSQSGCSSCKSRLSGADLRPAASCEGYGTDRLIRTSGLGAEQGRGMLIQCP